MSAPEWTIAAVVLVALVAWLMKAMSGREDRDSVEQLLDEVTQGTDEDAGHVSALTSDGVAFLPRGHGIAFVVAGRPGESELNVLGNHPQHVSPGDSLAPGDLIAARVRRGAPDHDPWRLEGLGRDHEYRAWRFETEDAAKAALAMVTDRIVRPPLDEDGEPVKIGDADYAEARRIEEEIERDVASGAAFDEDLDDRER